MYCIEYCYACFINAGAIETTKKQEISQMPIVLDT